jgi:hypothetical protein
MFSRVLREDSVDFFFQSGIKEGTRSNANSRADFGVGRALCAEPAADFCLMIRAIGPLRLPRAYTRLRRFPLSGPPAGALSNQLSALMRRYQLREQQEDLQAGLVDYAAMPPYPYRPRPPS